LCLSFHAPYRCAHSGACCKSGWPIPVEVPLALELKRSLASGELRLDAGEEGGLAREPLETPGALPPDVGALTRSDAAGVCAFYRRGSGLCAIHGQLGPGRLPSSCAHFPRVCLIDEDAVYVTLSHYCPTVAELLFDPAARREIAAAPPALLAGIHVEGLDARGQLPPLLRPGMLADRVSYRRWERFVVEELAEGSGTVEARIAQTASVTDRVSGWSPADGRTLEQHTEACIEESLSRHGAGRKPCSDRGTRASVSGSASDISRLYDHVRASCPGALAPPATPRDLGPLFARSVDPEWEAWSRVVGRYLAAKVFGSWLAYQGRGLGTVLAGAFAALAVVRVEAARQCAANDRTLDGALLKEAIRQADLLLVHLASREALADRLDHLVIP